MPRRTGWPTLWGPLGMKNKAKSWWRYLMLLLGMAVLGWLGWQLFLYRVLVGGRTWREALGGSWFVEYRNRALLPSGPQASLFRKHGLRSLLVDELIQDARFYEDDCVVYSTSRGESGFQFLGACGARSPVVLVAPTFDQWELESEGLKRAKILGQAQGAERRIAIDEIKRRARRQPPFQEGWFEASP